MKTIIKKDTVTSINATKIGSPTVNGFVVNNFSTNNYFIITGGSPVSASNLNSFEVCCKVKSPSTYNQAGRILNPTNGADSTTAPYIQFTGSSTSGAENNVALIWYNGSTYYDCYALRNPVSNTDYWLKWVYNGSTIKGYYSTNGIDFTLTEDKTPPYKPFFNSNEFSIGCRSYDKASVCVWNGSIYMDNLTIKLNNSMWLNGIRANIIDKVYAVKNGNKVYMIK